MALPIVKQTMRAPRLLSQAMRAAQVAQSAHAPYAPHIPHALYRPTAFRRFQSSMDDYESKIYNILAEKFQPSNLEVRDVSGGCGSMFSIDIESDGFKGMTMIKQHRAVNDVLKEEISKWHGLQLKTRVPS